MPGAYKSFLEDHGYSPFWADKSAYAAAFATVKINKNFPGHPIPGNSQIRAQQPAHITGLTAYIAQTAGGFVGGLLRSEWEIVTFKINPDLLFPLPPGPCLSHTGCV